MTIGRHHPLDLLRPDEVPCDGAFLTSYTFDATFFEETVLAALLGVDADPVETPRAFQDEGRWLLQRVPVCVVVDARHLGSGRRLPYDLLRAATGRTFHPKVALLTWPDHARLAVGSGNLTPGGLGDNAELGAVVRLDYARDAGLLRAVVAFAAACGARGEAFERFRDQLALRLGDAASGAAEPGPFLETATGAPLLERFLARIPEDARVHAVGVLAPFHQEDDAPPEAAVVERALAALAERGQLARGHRVDVGVAWEGDAVGPGGPDGPADGEADDRPPEPGELWGFLRGGRGAETAWWGAVVERVRYGVALETARGRAERSYQAFRSDRAAGRAWRVSRVRAAGPARLFERLRRARRLALWAFPEVHRETGRIFRRPLHGKLIAVATQRGPRAETHLLVGSPNATRAALLDTDANVEAALHVVLPGRLRLPQLCPELVPVPAGLVTLEERRWTPTPPNPARFVADAVYDATAHALTVTWAPRAPALRLVYPRPAAPLVLFEGQPAAPLVVAPFELARECAELVVAADGREGPVPIRVVHLEDLPSRGPDAPPSLADLVALYSGRYRAPAHPATGGPGGEIAAEALADGDWLRDVAPRDVFQAFFGRAQELAAPGLSPGGFRMLLEGRTGLRAFADRLFEAGGEGGLHAEEVWLYAQELARTLADVRFGADAVGRDHARRLAAFVAEVRRRAAERPGDIPGAVTRFYERAAEETPGGTP